MYTYQLRQRGEEFTTILQKALKKYKGVTVLREGVTCVSEEYDVIVKVDPEVLTKFSGSTTIGKICYEVHKGPKGGYYIWKEKTRGPHKGDCYKKYVTGTSFARSEEKDPTILEALENIIAGVCKSSWEYETKYEWSDENSEFWIGLLNNEFDPQDPDPDDIPGEDEGDGFGDGGDGFGDGGDGFGDGGDGFGDGGDGDGGDGDGFGDGFGDGDGEGPGDGDGEGPGDDDGEGPGDDDGEGPGDGDGGDDGFGDGGDDGFGDGGDDGFGDGGDDGFGDGDGPGGGGERICPNCEAELEVDDDGALYCPDCDWRPEDLGHCPRCGEELTRKDGIVKCPDCEWTIEDDDEILHCPMCGDDVIELMGRKECRSCDWCEEEEDNLCPECNEELEEDEDGELYCPACGWCEHEEDRCPDCGAKLKEGRGGSLYCPQCGWSDWD